MKEYKKVHNFAIRNVKVRVTIEMKGPKYNQEAIREEELKGNMINIKA